jgi:hypothetical protein
MENGSYQGDVLQLALLLESTEKGAQEPLYNLNFERCLQKKHKR